MSTPSNPQAANSPNAEANGNLAAPRSCKVSASAHGEPPSPAGKRPAPPCTLVIFGAGGDLTKRLLMPAL